jgi:hypothetical protein
MNAADIAAARRLIAQFEDRADGRHNSTRLAQRDTELRPAVSEQATPPHFTHEARQAGWMNAVQRDGYTAFENRHGEVQFFVCDEIWSPERMMEDTVRQIEIALTMRPLSESERMELRRRLGRASLQHLNQSSPLP